MGERYLRKIICLLDVLSCESTYWLLLSLLFDHTAWPSLPHSLLHSLFHFSLYLYIGKSKSSQN